MLADGGFFLVSFGLLFLFGFGVIYLLLWIVVQVLRGVGGGFRALFGVRQESPRLPDWNRPTVQHCAHSRCGHANLAAARFCARCGRPLQTSAGVGNG